MIPPNNDNIAQLLLVVESHLALMSTGEDFDTHLMLDAARYLVDYVGSFQSDGAELCHRLEARIKDPARDPEDLVRLGFAYCAELRRGMSEEAVDAVALVPAPVDDEERHRARFEELTHRSGCDCTYDPQENRRG